MKELRELIRDPRDDHDLEQKVVAAHLGLSQQTYSNFENGRRAIPVWVVVELAKYYKVSTDYLLGTTDSYPGNTSLKNHYLADVTMFDIMYDIQTLNRQFRRDLLRYIQYLQYLQKLRKLK